MADEIVKLPDDAANTGKKIDNETLTVGANTVQRQRVQVAGAAAAEVAAVKNAAPTTEYGVVTRNIPSGTQPISAASLPLPAGAATEVTLGNIDNSLSGTLTVTGSITIGAALPAGTANIGDVDVLTLPTIGQLPAALAAGGGMKIEGVAAGVAVPVSAASLPLPTGAATQTTLAAIDTKLGGPLDVTGAVVSVTVNGSLPLPTGASTEATLASVKTAVELIDDAVATSGTTTYTEATTKNVIVGAVRRDADTTLVNTTNEIAPLQVDANGRLKVEAFSGETLPVSLATVPLPTGAATETTLAAANTKLAGGLPAALAAGGGMKVEGVAGGVAQPVSIAGGVAINGTASVSIDGQTGSVAVDSTQLPVALTGSGNLKVEGPVSLSNPLPGGTNNIGDVDVLTLPTIGQLPAALAAGGGMKIEGVAAGVAVPVSAASLPLPTGAATETTLAAANTKLAGGLPAALAAGGGLKVEGIAGGVAQPVSLATVPLASDAATQTTLAAVSGKLPAALVSGRLDVVVGAALPAGTAKIGEFIPAPVTVRKQITPTGSTTPAYTSGDIVGTGAVPQQIVGAARASGGSGIIQSIIVHDKANLRSSIDLVFFDRSITLTADNTAFAPSDADMLFCLGVVPIGPWNVSWVGAANNISTLLNVGLPFVCNGSADLWFAVVMRSTPTLGSTDAFSFTFLILQD